METVEVLQSALEEARDTIACLSDDLGRLLAQPLVHATVIYANNYLDISKFQNNDLVVFVDGSEDQGRTARIFGNVDEKGNVDVVFSNLRKRRVQIGLGGNKPDIKLLGKNDGTNVTISHDGTPYEVYGVFGKVFVPGQAVKVNLNSLQIVESNGTHGAGDVCVVKSIVDKLHFEVEHNGNPRVVLNGKPDAEIETNDRVQLDRSNTVVVQYMQRKGEGSNKVAEDINVSWEDIGGCEEAKEAMIELFELPFAYPEIYKYYNKKMPKGGLLYGAPGVGKTLIGKAAYTSLCKRFGKGAMASGFIYVKGPELLNMWLGNSEANIRELFHRGKKHYQKTKIPAVLFIDEAEALLPIRGSGQSSDVEKTTVPMFLAEMDGLEVNHTIVLLATNRPTMIDPAIIRHGRCDRHIKVPRPNLKAASDILKIHLKGVPLKNTDIKEVVDSVTADLFGNHYPLYKLSSRGTQYMCYLRDVQNGAMIAGVVEHAVSSAIKRDLSNGKKPKGVGLADFDHALKTIYRGQMDQNHTFDLEDFCDVHKLNKRDLAIDKLTVTV